MKCRFYNSWDDYGERCPAIKGKTREISVPKDRQLLASINARTPTALVGRAVRAGAPLPPQ
ncbi:MAG: hypothetical protein OXH92_10645 [Bryobacterales bacterium]|nr:hypothetical protein [Bryobacterales bacterium]MDE0292897.1 hypothetical protein [Bryobacterales bacterium]MDE0434453.1 hypothetical protein [Bryobacterales bacterium]